jgi:hypothetical protein
MATKKFIFVVGEDVVGDIVVPGIEKFLPLQQALVSGINIIEVDPSLEIVLGQTYISESNN